MYQRTQYWKDGANVKCFQLLGLHPGYAATPPNPYTLNCDDIREKFYTHKTTIDQISIIGGVIIDLICCSRCPVNSFTGVFYNGGLGGKCLLRHRGLFCCNCLGQGWATPPLYPGPNNKFMDKTDCMLNRAPLHFCVGCVLWYLATQPRGRGEYAACKQPCLTCITHHLHTQAHRSAQFVAAIGWEQELHLQMFFNLMQTCKTL